MGTYSRLTRILLQESRRVKSKHCSSQLNTIISDAYTLSSWKIQLCKVQGKKVNHTVQGSFQNCVHEGLQMG